MIGADRNKREKLLSGPSFEGCKVPRGLSATDSRPFAGRSRSAKIDVARTRFSTTKRGNAFVGWRLITISALPVSACDVGSTRATDIYISSRHSCHVVSGIKRDWFFFFSSRKRLYNDRSVKRDIVRAGQQHVRRRVGSDDRRNRRGRIRHR